MRNRIGSIDTGEAFGDPERIALSGQPLLHLADAASEAESNTLARPDHPATPQNTPRILLVCAAGASTLPGSDPATSRQLARVAAETVIGAGMVADLLDLAGAAPQAAAQLDDNRLIGIRERWSAAHGVVIVTPTFHQQAHDPLTAMIGRLLCADGFGAARTARAGRPYGLVIHARSAGTESQRRNLADWLNWMGLKDAIDADAPTARTIGHAMAHDVAMQHETRTVVRAVVGAVRQSREGPLPRTALPAPPLGLGAADLLHA